MSTLTLVATFIAALCATTVVIEGVMHVSAWRADRRRNQLLRGVGPRPPTKWVVKKRDGVWLVQIRSHFLDPTMLHYGYGPLEYHRHYRTYYAAPTLKTAFDYIDQNGAKLDWKRSIGQQQDRMIHHHETLTPDTEEA